MVQPKKPRDVTWNWYAGQGIALLIMVIASWVNMSQKVSAIGQAQIDYNESQRQILNSITELRTIQLQQVEKLGELKGAVDQLNKP